MEFQKLDIYRKINKREEVIYYGNIKSKSSNTIGISSNWKRILKRNRIFLEDLSTVQNCVSYSNYQTFFNLLRNNADLMKLVMRVGTVSGKNKYRRK